jgi:hypothetical protein
MLLAEQFGKSCTGSTKRNLNEVTVIKADLRVFLNQLLEDL